MQLAERRETTHPAESAGVYLSHIDDVLNSNRKHRYDETVRLLSRANALLAADDERAIFEHALAQLRAQHGRKPTLMAKLDARGW